MSEFKHKHSLGQNFLKDRKVLIKIIDSVDVAENDLIIEIGPGQGALTKYLKLFHAHLRCYEIDERVRKYLDGFVDAKTEIVYKDFLSVNLDEELKNLTYNNLYIIANLPYYITTPILEKIINSKVDVLAMVLMVQNEVALRLAAKPGCKDYGALTVYLSYFYDVDRLFVVNKTSFDPVPKVDSAVIKLTKKKDIKLANNEEYFFNLVRNAFAMKRKNLRNNLKNYNIDKIEEVLKKYNLSLQDRAESVSLECFIDLANTLSK